MDLRRGKISLKQVIKYDWLVRGAGEDHPGSVDLAARVGTPIYPAGTGHVTTVYTNTDSRSGRYVDIYYPNTGVRLRFIHLDKVLVEKGELVVPTKQIATSGRTGFKLDPRGNRVPVGPHLHLQMYVANVLTDPFVIFDL
jgi:murein DD-endopeptidase MepM/ murein hydrolase activator NlpD